MMMPLQLDIHSDIVHFYVDGRSIEEPNIDYEEGVEEDNVVEAPLLADPQVEKETHEHFLDS